jgi:hypothetical protein
LNVIVGIIDDEKGAGALLGAVVLNLLDDARIFTAAARLRLGIFLAQPNGHELASALHLMTGAVGRPRSIIGDGSKFPSSGRHGVECSHPCHRICLAHFAVPGKPLGRRSFVRERLSSLRLPDLRLFRSLTGSVETCE